MYGTRWLHYNNYYEYMYFGHVLSSFECNGYNIVNAAQVIELIGQ